MFSFNGEPCSGRSSSCLLMSFDSTGPSPSDIVTRTHTHTGSLAGGIPTTQGALLVLDFWSDSRLLVSARSWGFGIAGFRPPRPRKKLARFRLCRGRVLTTPGFMARGFGFFLPSDRQRLAGIWFASWVWVKIKPGYGPQVKQSLFSVRVPFWVPHPFKQASCFLVNVIC